MKAEIIKKSDTQATLKIAAEPHELAHAKEHVLEHWRPRIKASGFRPGKAPDHIVEREMGHQTLQSETMEHALGHTYADAVNQHALPVMAQPQVEIKKFVPYSELEYEATVELLPPIKLPDYKKLKKVMPAAKVEPAKVQEVIEDLRRRLATRKAVQRPAAMGDEVKIDFAGTKDGKEVPGAASQNYTLKLGSNSFIPGFEETIVGMKIGDHKKVTLTFPKDYHEASLAGQPVEFAITLNEVAELKLPEVNDKFASEVGPFKTVAELKKDITDQLSSEAEVANRRQYESELLDDIAAKTKVELPERLVAAQLERLKSELNQRLGASGLDLEKYLQSQNQTQEQLEAQMKPEAEKRVKLAMILGEVSKKENITVSAEEVDGELAALRQRYTDPAMQKELEGEQVREEVFNHLLASRVVNKLVEYAQQ